MLAFEACDKSTGAQLQDGLVRHAAVSRQKTAPSARASAVMNTRMSRRQSRRNGPSESRFVRCINAKLNLLKIIGYFRKNADEVASIADFNEDNELKPSEAGSAAQNERQRRQGQARHATSYTFINAVGALSREHDI